MKNLKTHVILSFFIMFVLYNLLSQTELKPSFAGSTTALIVTVLFCIFLSKTSQNIVMIKFHWLSIIIFCISPSLLTFLITFFCICFRELIYNLQNTKQKNTKENIFFILSIIQPFRNTQNVFFLTFILIIPVWIALLLQELNIYFWDLKYLPFILFSFCYSKQVVSDIYINWCQDGKTVEVNYDRKQIANKLEKNTKRFN